MSTLIHTPVRSPFYSTRVCRNEDVDGIRYQSYYWRKTVSGTKVTGVVTELTNLEEYHPTRETKDFPNHGTISTLML